MMNIEQAIETLTNLITEDVDSADAMRYTQAALNLAHVKVTMQEVEDPEMEE